MSWQDAKTRAAQIYAALRAEHDHGFAGMVIDALKREHARGKATHVKAPKPSPAQQSTPDKPRVPYETSAQHWERMKRWQREDASALAAGRLKLSASRPAIVRAPTAPATAPDKTVPDP